MKLHKRLDRLEQKKQKKEPLKIAHIYTDGTAEFDGVTYPNEKYIQHMKYFRIEYVKPNHSDLIDS